MPWTPTLYSVSRPLIVRNLLEWIRDTDHAGARQTEALAWAKSELGFAGTVPNFEAVLNSSGNRELDTFPALLLVRRNTTFEESPDDVSLQLMHTLGFQMLLADASPDTLTEKVEVYLAALKALLWSCPRETMMDGVNSQGHPTLDVTGDEGDETRDSGSLYVQIPRIVASVKMLEVRSA